MAGLAGACGTSKGLSPYYKGEIERLEGVLREKTRNLRRLEAQRNELNSKGGACTTKEPGRWWREAGMLLPAVV